MDIRRLALGDLSTHAPWLLPRFVKVYPQFNERAALDWFRNILSPNDFLPLASDEGVALAYTSRPDILAAKAVVQVGFIWVRERANADHLAGAAEFLQKYADWAASMFLDTVLLSDQIDVPSDVVREKFKRVLVREVKYLRIGKEA